MTHQTAPDLAKWLVTGANIAIAIAIACTPFVFAPWTAESLEINKFTWLTTWTLFATTTLAIRVFLGKKVVLPTPLALIGFGIWIAVLIASASTSWGVVGSFLGATAQEYASVLTAIVSFLFFVCITIGAKTESGRRLVLAAVAISNFVLALLASLTVFGVNGAVQGLVSGSPTATGIVLITTHLFLFALVTLSGTKFAPTLEAKSHRLLSGISIASLTVALPFYLALDAFVVWIVALIGAAFIITLGFYAKNIRTSPSRFLPLGLLVIISVGMLALSPRLFAALPLEVGPNAKASLAIATNTWSEGRLLLGTGPGTFALAFDRYHHPDLNNTDFWDARFDRGFSHLITLFVTTGLLGTVGFAILVICIVLAHLHKGTDGSFPATPATLAFLSCIVAACFYPQTMVLMTVMMTFAGLGTAFAPGAAQEKEMKDTAAVGAASLAGGSLAIVAVLFIAVFTASRYSAEVVYAKALARESEANYDEAILLLDKAASRNRYNDAYFSALARVLLVKADIIARDPLSDPSVVQSLLASAINASVKATDIAPYSSIRWAERGDLYRDIAGVVTDGAPFSLVSYEEAVKLSPVNPKYRVGVGRAHLALAEALRQQSEAPGGEQYVALRVEALESADIAFAEAVALKPDYIPALYFQAVTLDARGLVDQAIVAMEKVRDVAPTDIGIRLNLALLYMRNEKNEAAKSELEKSLELAPTFANAHWYLSIIEEEAGNLSAAIGHIERILVDDPENAAAKQRLERLQTPEITEEVEIEPIDGVVAQ